LKSTTFRLTAQTVKNLSALSGVAYKKSGAILTFLAAPKPAPKISRRGKPGVDWDSFLREKRLNYLNIWRKERCSIDLPFIRFFSAVGEDELHILNKYQEIQTRYGAKALGSNVRR
jgi:hypothetical protein